MLHKKFIINNGEVEKSRRINIAMAVRIKYYIWGNGSDWEGLCTTFDIAMQGKSLDETRDFLEEAVKDFLATVEELPSHDKKRLLKRKSPLQLRLILALQYLQSEFRSRMLSTVNKGIVSHDKEIDIGAYSAI